MTDDGMDLLLGGAPTAKFPEVGAKVRGKVIAQKKQPAKDIDGNPKFFESGDPIHEIVFTLATELRDPAIVDDDGTRRLFAGGQMLKAIGSALRQAQWSKSLVGGNLGVKFDSEDPPKKRGYSPTKIFKAIYEPPDQADEFDAMSDDPNQRAVENSGDYDESPF